MSPLKYPLEEGIVFSDTEALYTIIYFNVVVDCTDICAEDRKQSYSTVDKIMYYR